MGLSEKTAPFLFISFYMPLVIGPLVIYPLVICHLGDGAINPTPRIDNLYPR